MSRLLQRLLTCLTLFFTSSLPMATVALTPAQTNLSSLLPSSCMQSGAFTQKNYLLGVEEPIVSEGVFSYSCDQGLIWAQREPSSQILAYQPAGQVFLETETGFNQLKQKHHKRLGRLLNKIFAADIEYLERKFLISDISNTSQELLKFKLEPKSSSLKRAIRVIEIEKQSPQPLSETTAVMQISIDLVNGETRVLVLRDLLELSNMELTDCLAVTSPLKRVCQNFFSE